MMKKAIFLLTALLVLGVARAQQPTPDPQQNAERVAALVSVDDYYALERLTPAEYELLPPILQLMVDASVGSRFNELERSNRAIETLLNDYNDQLDGQTQSWLFGLLLGNLRVGGEYDAAAQIAGQLLGAVAEDDQASRSTLEGMVRWFGPLSEYPKTSIARPEGDVTLPLYTVTEQIRNALGEPTEIQTLMTDVEIGGVTERFIFDTGCSHASFVSEEFAARHGIRIVSDSILISGVAAQGYARIGVLDSMRVGPVTVYNPTFTITAPNEAIDTLYKVPPVLGSDFMNLAGEMQLYPAQERLVLPAVQTPVPPTGRNLSIDTRSGQYTVAATCDGEPVRMIFDTGSVNSNMSSVWFEKHRERVVAEGKSKDIGVGGFGGTSRGKGYQMPSLRLGVGDASREMPDITVFGNLALVFDTIHDGYLGTDFVLKFDKVTINMHKMFVTAEPAGR